MNHVNMATVACVARCVAWAMIGYGSYHVLQCNILDHTRVGSEHRLVYRCPKQRLCQECRQAEVKVEILVLALLPIECYMQVMFAIL